MLKDSWGLSIFQAGTMHPKHPVRLGDWDTHPMGYAENMAHLHPSNFGRNFIGGL